ncbi:uncharacterized protein K452DRAFT_319883 [Aplosporella prunicola CBS 121167]|uniref:6-methylsalicylate decarboxylase n=1 Tax=Aplosporella prunicola CBS 121167 TaxID=1176127 RepID=A0A6A6BAK8_9PEZI|nr:uncharacterized protein K452DRAFT_319883 [Aplosporella prunicola CBS 121167]KAF2140393.1 hypothetical protein K452DRAFT_319883 [Aplosporella prunicola CBS 121167]
MSSFSSSYDRIDVHSHFLPPFYRDELAQNGHSNPDGMPAIPEWDLPTHLALMARLHITKSILSISSPGTYLTASTPPAAAADLTRRTNAYAALLKQQEPARLGFWASLPLPAVPETLAEIDSALADGADGFVLLSSAHGQYAGDGALDAVFARLDARGATLFIHPTTPCGEDGGSAAPLASRGYPNPMFEFMFETGRAVAQLFLSGAVARFPRLQFVIPHAGGAVPGILNRVVGFAGVVPGPGKGLEVQDVREAMRTRFWFDLAGIVWSDEGQGKGKGEGGVGIEGDVPNNQLQGLLSGCGVGPDRLLYGSDYPFTPEASVVRLAEVMEVGLEAMFSKKEVGRILSGNAEAFLKEIGEARKEVLGDGVADGV